MRPGLTIRSPPAARTDRATWLCPQASREMCGPTRCPRRGSIAVGLATRTPSAVGFQQVLDIASEVTKPRSHRGGRATCAPHGAGGLRGRLLTDTGFGVVVNGGSGERIRPVLWIQRQGESLSFRVAGHMQPIELARQGRGLQRSQRSAQRVAQVDDGVSLAPLNVFDHGLQGAEVPRECRTPMRCAGLAWPLRCSCGMTLRLLAYRCPPSPCPAQPERRPPVPGISP